MRPDSESDDGGEVYHVIKTIETAGFSAAGQQLSTCQVSRPHVRRYYHSRSAKTRSWPSVFDVLENKRLRENKTRSQARARVQAQTHTAFIFMRGTTE